jgi:UDP-N-acetylmuramoylalanine--D-glutamate ligase
MHGCAEVLLKRGELPLIGRHNELNAAAAAAAAYAFGADPESVRRGLKTARPVEHRIEFVRSKDGVDFYNDSKSTNMVATMTALDSFAGDVILLFGGRPKKESFASLAERIPRPVKAIIVFGEAVSKLREELGSELPLSVARDLPGALTLARSMAKPGDTVLLSPGCTSFDQFRNFEERGTAFKLMVRDL